MNGGQLQTVVEQLDRLGPLAEEHAGALLIRGWIALLTGRFAEAQRCLDRARNREPNDEQAGLIVALAIMIHQARGDIGAALAEADRSGSPVDATQAMALGVAMVGAGRFDAARTYLELAREMAATEPDSFVAAVAPISEAVAELESGDEGSAKRLADEALDSAVASRLEEAPQMALAHSVVARTSTDDNDAAVAARRGVELARRSPEAIMLAYALASAADVLCSQNDAEGEALLTEARSIIHRCPDPGVAGVYLATVEARHGRPVTAPPSQPLVEELTDREFAVLRLLPSELSQRDIAAELYVSLNTVKTHCRANLPQARCGGPQNGRPGGPRPRPPLTWTAPSLTTLRQRPAGRRSRPVQLSTRTLSLRRNRLSWSECSVPLRMWVASLNRNG